MKIAAIIQARMGSKRLPGKSLIDINGKPLIGLLIDSLKEILEPYQIILATSYLEENNVLEDYFHKEGLHVVKGSETNVASRFLEVIKKYNLDYFYRICGDSPLYDYRLLKNAYDRLQVSKDRIDFITSISNKGFPMGMNIELFESNLFIKEYPNFYKPSHFEHVTSYFYEQKHKFTCIETTCLLPDFDYEKYKFSIDTKEDLILIRKIVSEMSSQPYNYNFYQLIELYNKIK